MSDDNFLSRWSRKKHDAKRPAEAPAEKPAAAVAPVPTGAESIQTIEKQPEPAPLPPVESLTPESDFTPFMRAEVDPGTRRAAPSSALIGCTGKRSIASASAASGVKRAWYVPAAQAASK